jgi:hypothetical protein
VVVGVELRMKGLGEVLRPPKHQGLLPCRKAAPRKYEQARGLTGTGLARKRLQNLARESSA